jgi:hypothetical protein
LQDLAVGMGCFGAFGDVEHRLRLSVGNLVHCRTSFAPGQSLTGQSLHLALRRDQQRAGGGMRNRGARPGYARRGGHSHDGGTLRASARLCRNVPRSFVAADGGSCIFAMATNRLVQIKIRPSAAQATRRFLASIDRVRGAAIQAR